MKGKTIGILVLIAALIFIIGANITGNSIIDRFASWFGNENTEENNIKELEQTTNNKEETVSRGDTSEEEIREAFNRKGSLGGDGLPIDEEFKKLSANSPPPENCNEIEGEFDWAVTGFTHPNKKLDCRKLTDDECVDAFIKKRDEVISESIDSCEHWKDVGSIHAKSWEDKFYNQCKRTADFYSIPCKSRSDNLDKLGPCKTTRIRFFITSIPYFQDQCYLEWEKDPKTGKFRWVLWCLDESRFDGTLKGGLEYEINADAKDGNYKRVGHCWEEGKDPIPPKSTD